MADPDHSAIVSEFDRHVREHFSYLETEYGFIPCPQRISDINEPRDASVSIRYKTETVTVQIGVSVIGAGIAVNIKSENWFDAQENRRVKWVSLDSVVAFRTSGTASSLLHELTSTRRKYWPQGFLLQNMGVAVQALASRLRQHAGDILNGDVSSFPDIAARENE